MTIKPILTFDTSMTFSAILALVKLQPEGTAHLLGVVVGVLNETQVKYVAFLNMLPSVKTELLNGY